MTEERVALIEQAIADLGDQWNNRDIYERVGGSYANLSRYLKERRAKAHPIEETTTATAVVDPEPTPPLRPQTPLPLARWERDQTHAAEHALGLDEQRLRVQRQALEQETLRLSIQQNGVQQSDCVDEANRRQLQDIQRQRAAVEAQRLQVHQRRRDAHEVMLAAADFYESLHGQAARWLRRLRQAQRTRQAGTTAAMRGDAREEVEQALRELVALVGETEAAALAADPALQPDWLKE